MIRIDDTPDPFGFYGNQPEVPDIDHRMAKDYEMSLKFAAHWRRLGIIIFLTLALVFALVAM